MAQGAKPNAKAFSKAVTVFSYEGYMFAAQVEDGRLRVAVPCCQTYLADHAFQMLMLEAVEQRMGCVPDQPVFAQGWVGVWKMEARFACAPETGVRMRQVAGV